MPDWIDKDKYPDAADAVSKVREVTLGRGIFRVKFNPVVTGVAITIIWTFVIACMIEPDRVRKGLETAAMDWVSEVWAWFYIASQDIWIMVLVYVMVISKYGSLKLGRDDEEPIFSFATWFSLLFSAGVAVGLFYYSVAEPLWHYKGWGGARWHSSVKGYGNANEDSTHALMITWFHWGIHGWVPYTTMGAVLGIMSYRRGYPMAIRYCFWPLIGEECCGWMGDLIDIISIATTLFGVCTSLGLGAMQLNMGMQRMNHGFFRGTNYAIPGNETVYANPTCGGTGERCDWGLDQQPFGIQNNVETQIIIIICITLLATMSVVSGLNVGIVNLSRINLALGMFLMLTVLFLGETYFQLNAVTQALGYYIWYLPKISFQTDAFEALGSDTLGLGGAPDKLGGSARWMTGWTLFYWGWWISWGPFCGTFIAKISRGRTLRQFILGTLFVPSLYSFLWFGIFGSEGIRMQRMADASGLCDIAYKADTKLCNAEGSMRTSKCVAYAASYDLDTKLQHRIGFEPNCVLDPVYHGGWGRCREFQWEYKVEVGDKCVDTVAWVTVPCGDHPDPTYMAAPPTTGPCARAIDEPMVDSHSDSKLFNHFPMGSRPPCFVPAPDNLVCLYNQGTNDIFFDQISSYGPRGFSDMFCLVAMISLLLYFITTSDSGSFVIDMISANGDEDPPIAQRIFWSCTEGATAIALLYAGKNLPNSEGSLRALQSASLFMGLPYTFILFWCCQALILLVREESGEELKDGRRFKDRNSFKVFIISFDYPARIIANCITPGFTVGRIIEKIGGWPFHPTSPKAANFIFSMIFQGMYVTSVVLVVCSAEMYHWCIFGLTLYIGFASLLGVLRTSVRRGMKIEHGDIVTDFICGFTVPMFTLMQIEVELMTRKTYKDLENGPRPSVIGESMEVPQEEKLWAKESQGNLGHANGDQQSMRMRSETSVKGAGAGENGAATNGAAANGAAANGGLERTL